MNPSTQSNEANFKANQLLHAALLIGATLMTLIMGFLIYSDNGEAAFKGWTSGFMPISMLVMAFEAVASYVVWNQRKKTIPHSGGLPQKWEHFRSASILRWALLEGGTLISIILALLDGNLNGLAISAVGLALLYLARPSKEHLADSYGIQVG